MKVDKWLLLSLSLSMCAAAPSLHSQSQSQQSVVRIPDGGTSGRMESIFIAPKAHAPFSLTLVTDWSRAMNGGGSYTVTNQRRIVRDSKGRIYQERWLLVPKGSKIESQMDVFQITDPELHTWYNCITAAKICDLYPYSLTTTQNYQPAIAPSGPLANGSGFRQTDDLGISNTQGVDIHGYRETTTINPWVMGNDQPMVSMREFWYAPKLAINLISVVDTPGTGKQVFTVKDLSTSEPELQFFSVPPEYKVVDRLKE